MSYLASFNKTYFVKPLYDLDPLQNSVVSTGGWLYAQYIPWRGRERERDSLPLCVRIEGEQRVRCRVLILCVLKERAGWV